MALHLHSAACEAWLTEPPEWDDPLERVEFPRGPKPGHRDRHELKRLVRLRTQERSGWADLPRGWKFNQDHACRFDAFNIAGSYRYRLRVLRHHFSSHEIEEHKRYWRLYLAEAARCLKPPLPKRGGEVLR